MQAGVYKHYKGAMYLVLGRAKHSETGEALVVYAPLYVYDGPPMFVRPYAQFFEVIMHQGRETARFTYIGEEIPAPVAAWYDEKSGYRGADRVDD